MHLTITAVIVEQLDLAVEHAERVVRIAARLSDNGSCRGCGGGIQGLLSAATLFVCCRQIISIIALFEATVGEVVMAIVHCLGAGGLVRKVMSSDQLFHLSLFDLGGGVRPARHLHHHLLLLTARAHVQERLVELLVVMVMAGLIRRREVHVLAVLHQVVEAKSDLPSSLILIGP